MIQRAYFFCAGVSFFLTGVVSSQAETITLIPSADTGIFELDENFNFGAQDHVAAGTLANTVGRTKSRALYQFDVAGQLPENAIIESASLEIEITRTPSGPASSTFGLHRVLKPWGEGNKKGGLPGGAIATEGEVTWLHRFFPDELWGTPGGESDADYSETSGATASSGNTKSTRRFVFNESGIADLQNELENPDSNFGWMLISENESTAKTARRWATRENSSTPPQLEIEFSIKAPPVVIVPPVITSISIELDGATVEFAAQKGVTYMLEAVSNVESSDWASVSTTEATEDGKLKISDPETKLARRIYRIAATN
jgi:hypothetical protein